MVWQKNYWVVVLPVLLLMTSIGSSYFHSVPVCNLLSLISSHPATNAVNLYWFRHPSAFPYNTMAPLLDTTFPINFAQNVITTSLISFRLYALHRKATGQRLCGLQERLARTKLGRGSKDHTPGEGNAGDDQRGGDLGDGSRNGRWDLGDAERDERREAGTYRSLVVIGRIAVESALIYTVEMGMVIGLWASGHPAWLIVQHALLPSIGESSLCFSFTSSV